MPEEPALWLEGWSLRPLLPRKGLEIGLITNGQLLHHACVTGFGELQVGEHIGVQGG